MTDRRGMKRDLYEGGEDIDVDEAPKRGRPDDAIALIQHTGVESVDRARRPPNTEVVIAILSQRDYLDDYYKQYANLKDIKYILPCTLSTLRKDADKAIESNTNVQFWLTVKRMIQKEQQVGDELIAHYVFMIRSIQTFFAEYDALTKKTGEARFTDQDILSLTDSVSAIFDMLLLALIAKVHKETNNRLVRRQLTVMKTPSGALLALREAGGASQAMAECERRSTPVRVFDRAINNILNHLIRLFPMQAYESFVEANYDLNSQPMILNNNFALAEERSKVVVEKYNVTLAFATGYVEPGVRLSDISGAEGPAKPKETAQKNISSAIAPITGFRVTAVGSGIVNVLGWFKDTADTIVNYWRDQERAAPKAPSTSAAAAVRDANAHMDRAAGIPPAEESAAPLVVPLSLLAARADASGAADLNEILNQADQQRMDDDHLDEEYNANAGGEQLGGSLKTKSRRRLTRNRKKNLRSTRSRLARKFM